MSSGACPSCGDHASPAAIVAATPPFAATPSCYAAYLELSAYNVERGRVDFLHQEAVDAYAAQHPGPPAKPVTLWFALIGLHLAIDQRRTGREVQRAHQRLAKQGRTWERPSPPADLSGATASSVLASPWGELRDAALLDWAADVWRKWAHLRPEIVACTAEAGL